MTNVIACIDGTDVSTAVCDYAAWVNLRLDTTLILLHVLDKSEYPVASNLSGSIGLGSRDALLQELAELDEKRGRLAMQQGHRMLETARKRALAVGIKHPIIHQRHGDLIESLLAIEQDTRLLVLGKHEEHLRTHIGSRLENVVRSMHRPILITTNQYVTPQQVMIAFDGSDTTRKAITMVAASPLFKGMPMHVVMVDDNNAANQSQMAWAKTTLTEKRHNVTDALIQGNVEQALCDYRARHNIDILVMGAYGHSVIRRFLVGSTTTNVIRNASVPVLLLR